MFWGMGIVRIYGSGDWGLRRVLSIVSILRSQSHRGDYCEDSEKLCGSGGERSMRLPRQYRLRVRGEF
jgi:hypothetical protein